MFRSHPSPGPSPTSTLREASYKWRHYEANIILLCLRWYLTYPLSYRQVAEKALQSSPPEGGQWNGRKVADWIAQLIGRLVARQRGWEYLKQIRLRLRVPRPQHHDPNPQEQEE